MTTWQNILKKSITTPDRLSGLPRAESIRLAEVCRTYPMRINPYYLELIQKTGRPLWRQAVPDMLELSDTAGVEDPLDEENLSPVPNLVHKYPDRVLFLVCSECAVYCRFCTRKRKVGRPEMVISDTTIDQGLAYIRKTPAVREVLLSGGDPLLLSDHRLERILAALAAIPTVETVRIGTRVPCTLPMRITPELVTVLRKYHPLYINTHFNHPAELTPEAKQACALLADSGIPMGNQTVLLKGVNDEPGIMQELFLGLLRFRVKPYYLFQADLTRGTDHFRTPIATGLAIMRSLIGRISGMAVPTFALDAPGGGGKIPLTPDYITSQDNDCLKFVNYQGKTCVYPDCGIG